MRPFVFMLLLLSALWYDVSVATGCPYNFWRLTVKTLSSSGWETYISEIELYNNGSQIISVSDFSSDVAVSNKGYMFDSNSVSVAKFPAGGLPEVGNYIQWKCDPACAIDSIVVRQSTGGNNIPQWNVQYSDCGQNFTTKWTATTTVAVSTSNAPVATALMQCYYDAGNCTESNPNISAASASTTSLLLVIIVLLGCIVMLMIAFGVYFMFGRGRAGGRDTAKVSVAPSGDAHNRHDTSSASVVPSAPPQRHHAFLSHDWGANSANHHRVKRICSALQSLGMSAWLDEQQIGINNIRDRIAAGIDASDCMVLFITSNYMNKVNGTDGRDCCKIEFNYAFDKLGPQRMIAVVLDPELLDTKKWRGSLGAALGSQLYMNMANCDLEDEEVLMSKVKELQGYITNVIGKEMA
jgi:hypothetical protein